MDIVLVLEKGRNVYKVADALGVKIKEKLAVIPATQKFRVKHVQLDV
jgi:hypothetical protein